MMNVTRAAKHDNSYTINDYGDPIQFVINTYDLIHKQCYKFDAKI